MIDPFGLYFYAVGSDDDTEGYYDPLGVKYVIDPAVEPNGYTIVTDADKNTSYIIWFQGNEYPSYPPIDGEVFSAMQCMARKLGEGFIVTEGTRPKWKKPAGGATRSPHYKGGAIDISAHGDTAYQNRLLCAAAKCGFKRGQKYKGAQVHLDMEPLVGGRYGYDLPDPDTCCLNKQ